MFANLTRRAVVLTAGDERPSLDLQFAADKTLTARRGPTPTFTRASTGTFVGSNGLIQSAAINAPRFDHDPITGVCRGLLLEEGGRTNLVTRSQEINLWGGNAIRSISTTLSPDGNTFGTLATSIAGSFGGLVRSQNQYLPTAGQILTVSCWVKKGNWRYVSIIHDSVRAGGTSMPFFDLDTLQFNANGQGTFTTSIIAYPDGWHRLSITGTATALNGNVDLWMTTSSGSAGTAIGAGQTVLWWGAQLEVGAFPTSYIPTTTGTLARSADVCSITGGDFSGFYNQSEGTFYTESRPATVNGTTTVFGVSNGTANERWLNRFAQNEQLVVTSSGIESVLDALNPVAGTLYKVASAGKLNDIAMSINGLSVLTDTSQPMPTVDRATIGSNSSTVAAIRYFRKRLPNAKLQTLTTL
jgi:hypothetical protein